ncbi:MAG TPA: MaoC/PaaZ C-terminal domain-containing protein [Solirubrobacterales bacterium]|nr:MaoC/PaaZ C-terminal domain-containing protein [Solirubrobacterales bacterium]
MPETTVATSTPEVGASLTSRARTITEADVVGFAGLTGDWHPQHSDAEWAESGRFGERVAHGLLVLSYAVGLFAFDPERVVALRGIDDVTFKRPVLIGDTIRVSSTVDSVRPLDDDHSLVAFRWRILNQRDYVVARAKFEVLWRLDESAGRRTSPNGSVTGSDDLYAGTVLL